MPKMTAFLRNVADRLTNASQDPLALQKRDDGFSTAKGIDALFTRTQAEIDGEECLHDCESCTIRLPRKWSIDEDDELYGHIKGWSRHLIVATGKSDWVRDVEEEKGSVMEAVGKHGDKVTGGKLMLSASNMPVPDHPGQSGPYGNDTPTTVLLLPIFKLADGVTPNHVEDLIRAVVNTAPTNTSHLTHTSGPTTISRRAGDAQNGTPTAPSKEVELPAGLSIRNCPHKYLILLCSQATRDARCGQSAPLLRREFERHLRPLGLYRDLNDERPGGVGIYFISHVGGHKYSANVLVYRRAESQRSVTQQMSNGFNGGGLLDDLENEAAQCIWLARVRPEDCENVIRFTVLQGKVVKPERQLRGGFDREKGVVSW